MIKINKQKTKTSSTIKESDEDYATKNIKPSPVDGK